MYIAISAPQYSDQMQSHLVCLLACSDLLMASSKLKRGVINNAMWPIPYKREGGVEIFIQLE